jgi:hypothetical protein
VGDPILHHGPAGLEPFAYFLGQRRYVLRWNNSPVDHRYREEAVIRRNQSKVPGDRLLHHLTDQRLLPFPVLCLEGFDLLSVCVALKQGRELLLEVPDQLLHVVLEPAAGAGRELEAPRTVGIIEVHHVTPVGRWRTHSCRLSEALEDEGSAAGTVGADREDVEAGARDREAELEGFNRSLLADRVVQRCEAGRAVEAERLRVTSAAHLRGGQLAGSSSHDDSFLRSAGSDRDQDTGFKTMAEGVGRCRIAMSKGG